MVCTLIITHFLDLYNQLCSDYWLSESEKINRLPWYCEFFTGNYMGGSMRGIILLTRARVYQGDETLVISSRRRNYTLVGASVRMGYNGLFFCGRVQCSSLMALFSGRVRYSSSVDRFRGSCLQRCCLLMFFCPPGSGQVCICPVLTTCLRGRKLNKPEGGRPPAKRQNFSWIASPHQLCIIEVRLADKVMGRVGLSKVISQMPMPCQEVVWVLSCRCEIMSRLFLFDAHW